MAQLGKMQAWGTEFESPGHICHLNAQCSGNRDRRIPGTCFLASLDNWQVSPKFSQSRKQIWWTVIEEDNTGLHTYPPSLSLSPPKKKPTITSFKHKSSRFPCVWLESLKSLCCSCEASAMGTSIFIWFPHEQLWEAVKPLKGIYFCLGVWWPQSSHASHRCSVYEHDSSSPTALLPKGVPACVFLDLHCLCVYL